MYYEHVDVFSKDPLKGNGLTVVFPEEMLSDDLLLSIAQELKQFETIFIFPQTEKGVFPCRIFTIEEELPFAGHPVIGAGAVIHHRFFKEQQKQEISFDLSGRRIHLVSSKEDGAYCVVMNQGTSQCIDTIEEKDYLEICEALCLNEEDLDPNYPLEVVSTGLPYLLIPVRRHIQDVQIKRHDFEDFIGKWQAKFAYIYETPTLECRSFDNQGAVEDIATGSAAGPLIASLVHNDKKAVNEKIQLYQGKFVGRPSVIEGWVTEENEVVIQGHVAFFASGRINI